jgi:hypothetical protein
MRLPLEEQGRKGKQAAHKAQCTVSVFMFPFPLLDTGWQELHAGHQQLFAGLLAGRRPQHMDPFFFCGESRQLLSVDPCLGPSISQLAKGTSV